MKRLFFIALFLCFVIPNEIKAQEEKEIDSLKSQINNQKKEIEKLKKENEEQKDDIKAYRDSFPFPFWDFPFNISLDLNTSFTILRPEDYDRVLKLNTKGHYLGAVISPLLSISLKDMLFDSFPSEGIVEFFNTFFTLLEFSVGITGLSTIFNNDKSSYETNRNDFKSIRSMNWVVSFGLAWQPETFLTQLQNAKLKIDVGYRNVEFSKGLFAKGPFVGVSYSIPLFELSPRIAKTKRKVEQEQAEKERDSLFNKKLDENQKKLEEIEDILRTSL